MIRPRPCVLPLLVASALAACATTKEPEIPPLISRMIVNGKGVPNGRSDSQAAFAKLVGVATDPTFGTRWQTPIKLGDGNPRDGDRLSRQYLNALRGPLGEPIDYERLGACCSAMSNGDAGRQVPIDVYAVKVDGRESRVVLYVDMYTAGPALAPVGFTLRAGQ